MKARLTDSVVPPYCLSLLCELGLIHNWIALDSRPTRKEKINVRRTSVLGEEDKGRKEK